MAQFCKLCQSLEKSSLKQEDNSDKIKKKDMKSHSEIHRRHLRLVNGFKFGNISEKDMLEKCFSIEIGPHLMRKRKQSQEINVSRKRCKLKNQFKSSLSKFCQELLGFQRDKKAPLHCFECDADLKTLKKRARIVRIIRHVAIHLGISWYECRHCDYRFVGEVGVKKHLRKNHQIGITDGHYVDLSSNYEKEIRDTMKRCFGHRSNSEARSDQPYAKGTGRLRILNYCQQIFTNRDGKSAVVPCFECSSKLHLFGEDGTFRSTVAIDHACVHLKVPLFACRHCDNPQITKSNIRLHLKRIHNLSGKPQNYIDSSNNHQQEIIDMLKRCFQPPQELDSTQIEAKRLSFRSVHFPWKSFCRGLFANRKSGQLDVECLECHRPIRCFKKEGFLKTGPLVDHVYTHMQKILFKCRQCDFQSSTKGYIKMHLRQAHQSSTSVGHYDDLSETYLDETIAWMKRCFGQTTIKSTKRKKAADNDSQKIIKSVCQIESHSRGKPLLASRKKHCFRLVRKFNNAGKIRCGICSMDLTTTTARGDFSYLTTMNHAMLHLGICVYYCKKCPYAAKAPPCIIRHIKLTHNKIGKAIEDDYEDRSSEFQNEILAIISKCYDHGIKKTRSGRSAEEINDNDSKSTTNAINQLKARFHGNPLLLARRKRCLVLIKNFQKNGKIRCRICSKDLTSIAKRRSRENEFQYYSAMEHAMIHLDCCLYFCNRCPKSTKTASMIYHHVKTAYGIKKRTEMAKEFEDRSDEFQAEILGILSKCYDYTVKLW